jgi:hypothetical protein
MAAIPPGAPLSTQSNLYPHLAHREKAYLFPAINDAEYIFLDVTSSTYPIALRELNEWMQGLLRSGQYRLLAAKDGYVLFQKGQAGEAVVGLPDEFYTFAQPDEEAIPNRLRVRFGDVLELVGYDYSILNVVHAQQLPATVTTYWRALRPLELSYGFAFFFTRLDGAIAGHFDDWTPTSLLYPTTVWQEGEVVRLETPVLPIGRLRDVMVAVTQPVADSWSVEDRIQPIEIVEGESLELLQDGSLLKLFSFPQGEGLCSEL